MAGRSIHEAVKRTFNGGSELSSRLMLLLVEQDDAWGTSKDGFKVIRALGYTEDDDTVRPIALDVLGDLEAALPCEDPGVDRHARSASARIRELLTGEAPAWWPPAVEKTEQEVVQ